MAHLCAIYERIGSIPDKPRTIYRKMINLLVEEWDQQRSANRVSRYAGFEVDRKYDFLCHLAYLLTIYKQTTVFSKSDLLDIYKLIYKNYNLLSDESQQVVSELESHTGLLLQSGNDSFEFVHKSFQEYLTAEFLVRLPSLPSSVGILTKLPNELAISVTISSMPSEFFSKLIFGSLQKIGVMQNFIKIFISRLILEKPDFSTNTQVILSLLLLYSLYIESSLYKKGAYTYFDTKMIADLENIITTTLQESSKRLFEESYFVEYTCELENGESIYHMTAMKGIGNPNLPTSLYVRESLLNSLTAKI